ncbi:MAG: hypothetical protein ACE5JO_07080 [Candidatus Binatia bacterium]
MVGNLAVLLLVFLWGCLPSAYIVNDPNPGGVGFGEELFKLQGRVDYLYGHVLRNQKKLELQVGELQRGLQDLHGKTDMAQIEGDIARLGDKIAAVKAEVKSLSEEITAVKAESGSGVADGDFYVDMREKHRDLEQRMGDLEAFVRGLQREMGTGEINHKMVELKQGNEEALEE